MDVLYDDCSGLRACAFLRGVAHDEPFALAEQRMTAALRAAHVAAPHRLRPVARGVVEGIERLHAAGRSLPWIARQLNNRGKPGPCPRAQGWTTVEVRLVLALAGDPANRAVLLAPGAATSGNVEALRAFGGSLTLEAMVYDSGRRHGTQTRRPHMARSKFTTNDLPADLAACKAADLRTYVQRLGSAAKAHLPVPLAKAKKADLIAALERARGGTRPAGGQRSFTDEQAQQVVRMRHDDLLSWRSIANQMGLGTPGVARRAYRAATGLPQSTPLPRVAGMSGRPTAAMKAGEAQPEVLGAEQAK